METDDQEILGVFNAITERNDVADVFSFLTNSPAAHGATRGSIETIDSLPKEVNECPDLSEDDESEYSENESCDGDIEDADIQEGNRAY
jgi:hypothetical protein